MTTDEAILYLRNDPQYAELIHDSYLEENVFACAERFLASAEFGEARALVDSHVRGGKVLDLGAGTGIGSYALAKCGAKVVYALEPDPSEVVGRGVIRRLGAGLAIKVIEAAGEGIPLPDGELDLVYARQVLHHARDLEQLLRECARVLKSGGMFLACREHVIHNEDELKFFLDNHPVHRLAGGEHAYQLSAYLAAIESAGLRIKRVLDPWDTVINAFPEVRTKAELEGVPRKILQRRLGTAGTMASFLPGMKRLIWKRIKSQTPPGRMYSFLAIKP